MGKKLKVNTAAAAAKSLQSCPTLCDPRDGSPPGPSVHGVLQARALEWVATAFRVIQEVEKGLTSRARNIKHFYIVISVLLYV